MRNNKSPYAFIPWIGEREKLIEYSFAALVILVFLALYFVIASLHGLGMDESYYGRGAQHFADGDYLLQTVETDKPPLIFQVLGMSLILFGRSTMALKVPNAIALVLLLLLTYVMAKQFFGAAAGLVAIVIMATSPYMAHKGIGAMTDPIATLLLTASLYAATQNRLFGSGLWLGLSICARQMSLLFIPISFLAGLIAKKDNIKLWPLLKRFIAGLFLPLLYLLIWSAFFEKERLYWIWSEQDKIVMGKEQSPALLGRFSYWLSTVGGFFINPLFWWIGLAGLMALIAIAVIGKRQNRVKIESSQAKLLLLFSGIIVYYLISHSLLGIPLYARMMFPLLPLFAIILSFAVVRSVECAIPQQKPLWKTVGLIILAALLIWGTAQNAGTGTELLPYDDLPEAAQFIKQLPQEKKFIVSKEWGRHLHFSLHGSNIRYKNVRFKLHIENNLLKMMESYPEYEFFILLPAEDFWSLPRIERLISPRFNIAQIATSSRGLIKVFEIKPKAEIVHEGQRAFLKMFGKDGEELMPLTLEDIKEELVVYAKQTLQSEKVPNVTVEPHPSLLLEDGYFRLIELQVPDAVMQDMPCKDVTVEYQNPRIDLIKLFSIQHLVVLEAQREQGELVISEQALSSFIQRNNPNLQDVKLTIIDDEIKMAGQLFILNKKFSFALVSSLYVDENGWVNLRLLKGKLGKLSVPTLLLRTLDDSINPAFVPKSEALGLRCSSLKIERGQIRLFLESSQKNNPVHKPK